MSYLSTLIGREVTIDLTTDARDDRSMKLFYDSHRQNGYISNKMIGIENHGIWLEGFQQAKKMKDDKGNDIPLEQQKYEDVVVHVFIPFNYICGMFVVDEPNYNPRTIGFN